MPKERGPGRPPQPYCLDCQKAGHKELKAPGLGYCKRHHTIRQKSYRRAREANVPLEEGLVQQLREELMAADVKLAEASSVLEFMIKQRDRLMESVADPAELLSVREDLWKEQQWHRRALKHIEDPIEYPHPDDKDTRSLTERKAQEELDRFNASVDLFRDVTLPNEKGDLPG
jgi:hypothetical protein